MNGTLAEVELRQIGFRRLGSNVRIHRSVAIFNADDIEIGDNCRIDAFALISGSDAGVKIGCHVHIASGAYLFGGGGIHIDDFAGISARTILFSTNDDYSGDFMTGPTVPSDLTNVVALPVYIGRHVVIGAGSIVLPGVSVYEGAAVGALSLVNRDVEPFTIAGGNPLRIIRPRRSGLLTLEKELLRRNNMMNAD